MGASLYKLAEKAYSILEKGDMQALIEACQDAYAVVAKREYYENKQDGVGEVEGVFFYSFGKTTTITPELDSVVDKYYISVPSSYLRLPCEAGINMVSYLKGQSKPFVRISAADEQALNLLGSCMGGRQPYYVEGAKMYFPKMTADLVGPIFLRMAIALDNVDPEENLNIPPNLQSMIVDMVVAKYQPKPVEKPETLK